MAELKGFMFPRTATGQSSILPPPPWHYSGEMLTVEYRSDPDRVAELLPDPLEPADEDPGAVALVWAMWQSCSDSGEELLDPVRAQYGEVLFVVRAKYEGEHVSRCVYIWVDKDYAMVRGLFQGYPKKLGSVHLTRPARVGRAGPRLEPGGKFGATLAAYDRRLAEVVFTITGTGDGAGFVNSHPMHHTRYFPSIDPTEPASMHELVTMKTRDAEVGTTYVGDVDLRLFDSPTEEFALLQPREVLGGFYREVAFTFDGGTTLERYDR